MTAEFLLGLRNSAFPLLPPFSLFSPLTSALWVCSVGIGDGFKGVSGICPVYPQKRTSSRCPLWAKSGPLRCRSPCPLYPPKADTRGHGANFQEWDHDFFILR